MTGAEEVKARRSYKPPDGLTYEMLLDFGSKITILGAKFEVLSNTITTHGVSDRDHEVRLRALETRLTTLESTSTTSRGNWKEVWYVGLAVLSLVTSTTSTLVLLFNSGHAPH